MLSEQTGITRDRTVDKGKGKAKHYWGSRVTEKYEPWREKTKSLEYIWAEEEEEAGLL